MEDNLKIMDLPKNERPQERLLRYGAESLSNSELLAVVLRTGTSKENILQLCNRIIKECGGLRGILNSSAEDLMNLNGIKEAKASQILALVELSKRFYSYGSGEEYKIRTPKDAADLVISHMKDLNQEILKVIYLNTKNIVIGVNTVSMGSLNSSIVHPREVFSHAIKKGSASIIVCHNHPSGDVTPSIEDINITKRLKECGKILGIDLLDHIIVGKGSYVSLKEKGIV
ncbi:DNA repair protein RadC [Clostridium sp. MSJ-4]|uniref:DNA repair protein RadC n=1 Tax=Clostridium simiarum TaxID=2841506 RepID=A0ABS6F395_9CLOT|nr:MULTISPECIES: DNA repair protein RadC [Clostridium]MBU5592743.1 DNA repair protein RadC [Clostridium simiarum]